MLNSQRKRESKQRKMLERLKKTLVRQRKRKSALLLSRSKPRKKRKNALYK